MNSYSSREYRTLKWENLLAERFLPGWVKLQNNDLGGQLDRQARYGHLWLAQLSVQPQSITHAEHHLNALAAGERSSLIVHVVEKGSGFIEQDGVCLPFGPGDITFRNLDEPSRIVFDMPGRFYALRLPTAGMHMHGNGNHSLAPRVVHDASPLAETARQLLDRLVFGDTHEVAGIYLSFALPWLFAAAYHSLEKTPPIPPQVKNESRWQQVLGYIEQHLFEVDDLSAGSSAKAIGVSERYLHRLFAQRGLRFSKVVLERRLDAAHALVTNTTRQTHSIASIAYQCGFKEPAHFSRLFKQRFGKSPREYRSGV